MDADKIFETFGRFSERLHTEDAYRRKAAQITSVNERRCGNCDHWMKTTCVPEKQRGQFRSNGSPACVAFMLSDGSRRLSDQFIAELAVINEKRLSPQHTEQR